MTYTTTHKKASGTSYSKGLAADPTGTNFPTTAHEGKVFASLAALFALASFQVFPNLEIETRPAVDIAAAYYLDRRPQTLRICGRLAFPTGEIKRLLGVSA